MPLLRNLLGYAGIHPDRLVLDWVSSAEAPKFAKVATEFTDTVRTLGPIERDVIAAEIGKHRKIVHRASMFMAANLNPAVQPIGKDSFIPRAEMAGMVGPAQDPEDSTIEEALKDFLEGS